MGRPPDGEKRRPAESGAPRNDQDQFPADPVSIIKPDAEHPRHRPCGPHLKQHFCISEIVRRRSEYAEFKALVGGNDPREMHEPSTYSLEPDELKSRANSLVRDYGFSIDEVVQVVDIAPAVTR